MRKRKRSKQQLEKMRVSQHTDPNNRLTIEHYNDVAKMRFVRIPITQYLLEQKGKETKKIKEAEAKLQNINQQLKLVA